MRERHRQPGQSRVGRGRRRLVAERCTPSEIFERPFDHHDDGFGSCHRDLEAVTWCSSKVGGLGHLDAPVGDIGDMMGDLGQEFNISYDSC